jgi:hypothetical protein
MCAPACRTGRPIRSTTSGLRPAFRIRSIARRDSSSHQDGKALAVLTAAGPFRVLTGMRQPTAFPEVALTRIMVFKIEHVPRSCRWGRMRRKGFAIRVGGPL